MICGYFRPQLQIIYKNCRKGNVSYADFTCSLSGSELGEIVTPAADYSSAMCATCESNTLLLSMPSAMHSSNDPRILACRWVGGLGLRVA